MNETATREMTETESVLADMLRENTGRALCDSGYFYGRHWQRNAGRDFLAEPETTLRVRKGYNGLAELDVTFNVFHWLASRLTFDAHMNRKFQAYASRAGADDRYHLDDMEAFASLRNGTDNYMCERPLTVNTYNGEDILSQTIQYVMWHDRVERDYFIALQIHGGCDVRGGYTVPRVFRVSGNMSGEASDMFDNARGTIWEAVPEGADMQSRLPGIERDHMAEQPYWTTDDSCHWYPQGCCGRGYTQLEEYPVVDEGDGDAMPADGRAIRLDADGVAYGPIHGGRMHASFN